MDAGLLVFVATKGGMLLLLFVMWRQAKRAAEDARAEREIRERAAASVATAERRPADAPAREAA